MVALLAAGILLDTLGYPAPLTAGAPGPAFFPRLVAAFLLAAAVALAVRRPRTLEAAPSREGALRKGALRLAAASGWIAAFLVALPLAGHLATVPVLVVGLMWLAGERSARTLVLVSLLFGAFVHLLFVRALGVPLP